MLVSLPVGLDPDLLRSFVCIAEEGSFTRAGQRVGRTQSAVSMQLQRLETQLGQRLVSRSRGGTIHVTPHGQFLLDRARELLALNDRIWTSFQSPAVSGTVRFGTPDDYALRYVPRILKRFAESYPAVEVEVLCLPSSGLVEHLREGDLDLALVSEGHEPRGWPAVALRRAPLSWITSTRFAPHRLDPLPLSLAADHVSWRPGGARAPELDHCSWRDAALRALDAAGLRYRIAYRSATQIGTQAPVLAGLAVTVATTSWLPDGLREVRPEEGLPPLPDIGIMLLKSPDATQPVTDALARYIADTFRAETDTAAIAA